VSVWTPGWRPARNRTIPHCRSPLHIQPAPRAAHADRRALDAERTCRLLTPRVANGTQAASDGGRHASPLAAPQHLPRTRSPFPPPRHSYAERVRRSHAGVRMLAALTMRSRFSASDFRRSLRTRVACCDLEAEEVTGSPGTPGTLLPEPQGMSCAPARQAAAVTSWMLPWGLFV